MMMKMIETIMPVLRQNRKFRSNMTFDPEQHATAIC